MLTSHTSILVTAIAFSSAAAVAQDRISSRDLLKLRSVTAVQLSPDAGRIAYVVENNDGSGRPYGQLWVMTLADGKSVRFGGEKDASGTPEWSPDGQSIAYRGRLGDKSGLIVARPDGSGARFIAEMQGPTRRCRARARRSHGRLTASASRSFLPCRDRRPPTRPAIRSSSRGISTSRTPPKA
jgi:dipeptidyl aminopeptidase/acylaminoacyl peptidase